MVCHKPVGKCAANVLQDEDEERMGPGDWKNPPCEVCGRCYPHEHVKAVYRDHGSSDDEGSNFDD